MTCPCCGAKTLRIDYADTTDDATGLLVQVEQRAQCSDCRVELLRRTAQVEYGPWHREVWMPVPPKAEAEALP